MDREKFANEYLYSLSIWAALGKAMQQSDLVTRAENAIRGWNNHERTDSFIVESRDDILFDTEEEWYNKHPLNTHWTREIMTGLSNLTFGVVRAFHDDRFTDDISDIKHVCNLIVPVGGQKISMDGTYCPKCEQVTVDKSEVESYLAAGYAIVDLVRSYTQRKAEQFVTSLATIEMGSLYAVERKKIEIALEQAKVLLVPTLTYYNCSKCGEGLEMVRIYYDKKTGNCLIPSSSLPDEILPQTFTEWGPRQILEAEKLIPS